MAERRTPEMRQLALNTEASRRWRAILHMSGGDVAAAQKTIESTFELEMYTKNPDLLAAVKRVVAEQAT